MENQEVLVAFAQAIQELAAKTATAESALHCLIQAQDEPTRARFGEAFNTVARGLIQPRPDRPSPARHSPNWRLPSMPTWRRLATRHCRRQLPDRAANAPGCIGLPSCGISG
ncbi:hypothetical protein D557_2045 [Bordetella holmesii 70147]|nr:hypothetical protein D557_2045 [Bordetella holmesii 70147]